MSTNYDQNGKEVERPDFPKLNIDEPIKWSESFHRLKVTTRSTVIKTDDLAEIVDDLKRKPELTQEEKELLKALESPVSFEDWKPIVFSPPDKFTILDKSGSEPKYKGETANPFSKIIFDEPDEPKINLRRQYFMERD